MTPEEWERCDDPYKLLEFLRARALRNRAGLHFRAPSEGAGPGTLTA